jgi:hypothetical protein
VVQADEDVCIAVTESQVNIQGGKMKCLTGRDLMGYDYVSISKDEFVPISVKSTIGAIRLAHDPSDEDCFPGLSVPFFCLSCYALKLAYYRPVLPPPP